MKEPARLTARSHFYQKALHALKKEKKNKTSVINTSCRHLSRQNVSRINSKSNSNRFVGMEGGTSCIAAKKKKKK